MKQINVWFEDNEFDKVMRVKQKLALSWHDLILTLITKEDKK